MEATVKSIEKMKKTKYPTQILHGCARDRALFVSSIFFFFYFFFFTFCVSSLPIAIAIAGPIPTTTPASSSSATTSAFAPSPNPPTPLLKAKGPEDPPTTTTNTTDHVNLKIVLPLTLGALLIILVIVIMACLKFPRFRIRRRPIKGATAVVDEEERLGKNGELLVQNKGKSDREDGPVRRFSWEEIERLTMNFSTVIGSGGFSTVYLAHFPDSTLGAVKIHCGSERLNRVFKQELDILLHLRHHNIVKLLGYCDDREEGALVFEYVPSGNLQERLHGGGDGDCAPKETVLSWKSRVAIAFQLAQAIEYLHEKCTLQIVHGDIKASNILLDEQLDIIKLCDFGFAKMGFSSTVLPPSNSMKHLMMGSPGYTDPHYLRTGIASKKNDVYSFGVIILELVTGMGAFCSEKGQMLTSIAGPKLMTNQGELEATMVAEMVDPRLGGEFDLEEAKAMLSISAQCLGQAHTLRPSATQILQTIRETIPSISLLFSHQKDSKLLLPVPN